RLRDECLNKHGFPALLLSLPPISPLLPLFPSHPPTPPILYMTPSSSSQQLANSDIINPGL
ncbi:hypothetical protein DXO226_04755, partial [Xanthomonas oryzae pv. oryzae]